MMIPPLRSGQKGNDMRHSITSLGAALLVGTVLSAGAASAQTVALVYSQPLSQQAVASVQQRLRQEGAYSGTIDGAWGPDSVLALQQFQQRHGLQPSGTLNQATVASLGLDPDALLGSPTTAMAPPQPRVGTLSPRAVQAVQDRLRGYGFYRGPIDGVWGPGTQQALAAFQQGRGLQPNGQINPATAGALGLNEDWLFAGR